MPLVELPQLRPQLRHLLLLAGGEAPPREGLQTIDELRPGQQVPLGQAGRLVRDAEQAALDPFAQLRGDERSGVLLGLGR